MSRRGSPELEPFRFPFLRAKLPPPERWTPYLKPAYAAGRFSNFGPANEVFQQRLEGLTANPNRRAISCASATGGLAAVLMGLSVQGDVAMPSFTFPATLDAVLMAGCRPVLCDVDPLSWELSPQILESVLSRQRISAVLHVRAFGLCRDLQPIERLCADARVPLIVDAAAAFGGRISPNVACGGQGTAEVFSFHVTKVFGIGEGGAIFCGPDHVPGFVRALNFGLGAPTFSRALNAKLPEVSAAIGLSVLETAEQAVPPRAAAAGRYADFFRASGCMTPHCPGEPPWQCFPVLFPEGSDLVSALESAGRRGLELRRYYRPALHRVVPPQYAILHEAPVATSLAERMACFPIYPDMHEEDQAEIIEIAKFVLDDIGCC